MTAVNSTQLKAHSSVIPARIISQTPGRIRFRLIAKDRQYEQIQRITDRLRERLEIYRVGTNGTSGSISVRYATEHLSQDEMLAILRDLGVVFGTCTVSGKSGAAASIANAVSNLNQGVGTATEGVFDLRFFMPLGFATLALRQLWVQGLRLETIPWYVLAWYAFDSFIKLHGTSEPESEPTLFN